MIIKQLVFLSLFSLTATVYAVEGDNVKTKTAQQSETTQQSDSAKSQQNSEFGDYTYIEDMVDYVEKNRLAKEGERTIYPDKLIVFDGEVMSLPKSQKTSYLQEALLVAKINPSPVVEDGIFIKVGKKDDGSDIVIPVYVDKSVISDTAANKKIQVKQKMRFAGIHIYSYSKGPAIVVESAVLLTDK